MSPRSRVLLVSLPDGVSATLTSLLFNAGHETVLASDFASAKSVLADRLDLLITDLKLGAYNGIHLAIRAASLGTPVIVIGDPDPVLEADAERQHATYLTTPLDLDRLIETASNLLDASRKTRRSERKRVSNLEAFADDVQARVLDVSYDGLRIETSASSHQTLPRYFVVRMPQFQFVCRVQRVWTTPAVDESTRTVVWCGAAVASDDLEASSAWKTLVDTIPGAGTGA